jgi:hypothetical protein
MGKAHWRQAGCIATGKGAHGGLATTAVLVSSSTSTFCPGNGSTVVDVSLTRAGFGTDGALGRTPVRLWGVKEGLPSHGQAFNWTGDFYFSTTCDLSIDPGNAFVNMYFIALAWHRVKAAVIIAEELGDEGCLGR